LGVIPNFFSGKHLVKETFCALHKSAQFQ